MRGRGSAWSAAACRRCVCLGPGWNPALHKHRAADESSQNRPFLLTRTRLPRRPALEGRVPPRPLARVEPSPPPNRNHRPGGVSRPSKGMLSPRVEAGALGAGAAGGPLQAGKRWPGAVVHLQEQQQRRNDRSAQPRKNGPGRGAVDTSLEPGCVCSPADRPVLGSGQGGSSVGFGDPLVYRALAPALPAQPPRQPVQKLKCAVPSKSKRFCLAGFLRNDPRHNGRSRNARGIGDPASAHQQHLTGSLDGPGQAPLIMGR